MKRQGNSSERKYEGKGRLLQLLLGLALAILIIAFAATVGLNLRGIYSSDIDRYRLEVVSGLSKERLEENFRILVDYNNIWGAKELNFPDFPMSEHGRIHFEEVKRIFCGLQWAGIISAILIAAYVAWTVATSRKTAGIDKTGHDETGNETIRYDVGGHKTTGQDAGDYETEGYGTASHDIVDYGMSSQDGSRQSEHMPNVRFLKYGALLVIIVPALLGCAMAINWDMTFVVFHKLLFRNDYWLFDYRTDPVITVLPDQFFMHVALAMIAVALLSCAICFIIYGRLRAKADRKQRL